MKYSDYEKNLSSYMAKTMVFFGVIAVVELILYYILHMDRVRGGYVPHLGWAISNTIATYFTITIPMCFYMYVKKQTKKEPVQVNDLSEEQKEALRKELLKDLTEKKDE